ncbi:adenosine 5'-monophosphoramidase HINT3-like isoform X2 [Cebidichthys violaceus]|uniref:adenosine 5'-monophosphoramidase HINT3-like isoform X2 n=1 Tax=Cebidichthys violaceus TaxID=271503 RepID=UPI0035CC9A81
MTVYKRRGEETLPTLPFNTRSQILNMAELHYGSSPGTKLDQTCVFCLIAHNQDKETEVIKENKELVCFRDIVPAAPHHYLVVPKQHIRSCLSLHRGHVHLVERMADMGKAVLRDQGITNMKDISLGFHQPPYTSVDHLHLHVLAPASQIYKHMMYKFIPKSLRKNVYRSV